MYYKTIFLIKPIRGLLRGKKKGSLTLNTLQNSKKTLEKIIKLYNDGQIDYDKYKGLIYGLSQLLAYYKAINDIETNNEIKKLYDCIKGINNE